MTIIYYPTQDACGTRVILIIIPKSIFIIFAVDACFYILSALALKHNFRTSKHHQLIGWFNKNFIKLNLVDKKYSDILKEAFDSRTDSDYGDFISFSKEEVITLFNNMKDFVSKIESQILIDL